jgi:hypothetical protein
MKKIDLNDKDVIRVTSQQNNLAGLSTATIAEYRQKVAKNVFSSQTIWLEEGVECEILFSECIRGWQSGKLRLVLEFIPDNPDAFVENSPPALPTSPLDDLRSNLNMGS